MVLIKVRNILIFTILIGIFGLALNRIFGNNTIGYIEQVELVEGITMYRYDFWQYFKNIETVLGETPDFIMQLPTRVWQNLDAIDWPSQLGNNLAVILDYVIFIINVLIWPIRIGGYTARIALSILGINMVNTPNTDIQWLLDLIDALRTFGIPYV